MAFLLALTLTSHAQISRGVVQEGLTLDSKILGTKVRYSIYLPFDYETSSRFYPVVYLLHGYTDNDMGWIQFGEANLIADEAIAKREIPSMIIAMPDAGVSWYINNYNGSVRFEDFFFQEFMPYIESHYRIRAEKSYRGVAGLSMGGIWNAGVPLASSGSIRCRSGVERGGQYHRANCGDGRARVGPLANHGLWAKLRRGATHGTLAVVQSHSPRGNGRC